jgi:hypothetical protein
MSAAPSLPMQFGVPLNELSFLFFGCLGIAIWLVYVFCQKRFAERSITESSDWIYQLLPRQLATREEYSKGFLIYFGTLAAFVVLLSLLGPKNLEPLGIKLPQSAGYVIVPLAIAFILIGALPTVPGLTLIEKNLREYAHKRAFIPDAARATADRLAAADFDFTSYQGEALESPEMRGVEPADFTRSRRSLGHSWARLCCLVYAQKSYRMSGVTEPLDARLLRDYEKDLEFIENKKQSMEDDVAAYRAAKARDPFYTNDDLRRAIRENLYKLYILLGCAVRLKQQPYEDFDLALGEFGFRFSRTNTRCEPDESGDLQLVGLTVVAVSITLVGLAAWGLGQLGLWTMSPMFPQKVYQPFLDTASTLVPNAAAIMLADLVRKRAINKGWWFSTSGTRRRGNIANYIRVALASGVAGYVGLILWGLGQQVPTSEGLIIDAPFALLAMVAGGFYVYHLDNAEICSRPSQSWVLGSQIVLTGVCGLIATCATGELIFGGPGMVIDKILLATVVNAVVGLALAWYIPQAAAAARYNPLSAASKERVGALETAAKARLGEDSGALWIDETHPTLGNRSPRVAAVLSVEGFESAIGLLQGPRELAA